MDRDGTFSCITLIRSVRRLERFLSSLLPLTCILSALAGRRRQHCPLSRGEVLLRCPLGRGYLSSSYTRMEENRF